MKSKKKAKLRCSVRGLDEEESIRGGPRLSHTGANANMRPLTSYEKAKALGRARAFKSENPFFKAAMRPSYVHTSYRLCVPSSFARKYFTKNHGYVTLSVLDGRTWPVKYCNRTKSRVVFCHGWMAFAKDNKLAVGDFCIFELINITEMSFKVVFFRPEDVESLLSPAYTGGANQVEPSESLVAKPQSDWNSKDGSCVICRLGKICKRKFSEGGRCLCLRDDQEWRAESYNFQKWSLNLPHESLSSKHFAVVTWD
ncbi:B3 domain-containing transcription factor [Salix suchowensis]|nr:B3 domain-containing transcription factor [Salix suchowensis]